MARKQLGVAPSDTLDAATLGYVQANKGSGSSNVVVSQTNPGLSTPGIWVQLDSSNNILTFWIETTGTAAYPTWSTAVNSNRTTKQARWVAVGDSITEGQGASTRTNRWTEKVLAALRSNKPTTGNNGRDYIPSYYAHYMGAWNTSDVTASTGSPSTIDYVGNLGYRSVQLNAGASRTWAFNGTDIDILYANVNNGSTFTYQIDSNAAVSVTQQNGFNSTGIVQVSGLAAGNHTVTIATPTGQSASYVNGFGVYSGDRSSGIHMFDSGHFGHYVNSITGDSGGFTAWTGTMNLIAPDMVTFMFGTNEYNSGTAVATFQSNYTTLVNAAKGFTKVPSIMLIIPYRGADSVSTNRVAPWTDYVAAIKTVATNTGVGVLDLSATMPQATTSGTGYYDSDGNHPNDSGHAYIANAVVNAMGV